MGIWKKKEPEAVKGPERIKNPNWQDHFSAKELARIRTAQDNQKILDEQERASKKAQENAPPVDENAEPKLLPQQAASSRTKLVSWVRASIDQDAFNVPQYNGDFGHKLTDPEKLAEIGNFKKFVHTRGFDSYITFNKYLRGQSKLDLTDGGLVRNIRQSSQDENVLLAALFDAQTGFHTLTEAEYNALRSPRLLKNLSSETLPSSSMKIAKSVPLVLLEGTDYKDFMQIVEEARGPSLEAKIAAAVPASTIQGSAQVERSGKAAERTKELLTELNNVFNEAPYDHARAKKLVVEALKESQKIKIGRPPGQASARGGE